MTRPNLTDPDELRAYRAELRGVYRPWRYGALALLMIALIGSLLDPAHQGLWEVILIVGAVLTVAVIVARTRYHRGRMREDDQV